MKVLFTCCRYRVFRSSCLSMCCLMWVGWRLNVNCKLHDVREKLSTQRLRQATGNDGIPHVLQWTGMMMMMMMMMMMKQGNSGQYLKQHNKRRGLMSWCPKSKEGNKTGIQEHKKMHWAGQQEDKTKANRTNLQDWWTERPRHRRTYETQVKLREQQQDGES